MTAGLLVLVLARMRSRPPLERVVAYAWHPLAVSEVAAGGHVDALAVLALAGLLAPGRLAGSRWPAPLSPSPRW